MLLLKDKGRYLRNKNISRRWVWGSDWVMGRGRVWGQSSLRTIGHQGRRPCSLEVRQLSKVVDVHADHYLLVLNPKLCWGKGVTLKCYYGGYFIPIFRRGGARTGVASSFYSSRRCLYRWSCYDCGEFIVIIFWNNTIFKLLSMHDNGNQCLLQLHCYNYMHQTLDDKEWMLVLYICNCKCRDIYLHLA